VRYLLILLLSGCTIVGPSLTDGKDECGVAWTYRGEPIPESRWKVEETNDIFLKCMFEEKAEACSVRYRAEDGELSGIIYIPDEDGEGYCKSRAYYLRHEGLHLRGWVHPDWTRGR
jgi:hypothetical protein